MSDFTDHTENTVPTASPIRTAVEAEVNRLFVKFPAATDQQLYRTTVRNLDLRSSYGRIVTVESIERLRLRIREGK